MKNIAITVYILFLALLADAQKVQWAHELVKYSSEYSPTVGAAREVLGPPNMMVNKENPLELAWTPDQDSDGNESIEVRFQYGMNVSQIAICESLNPGSIHKIFLKDTRGKEYKVYENKSPQRINKPLNWFYHKIGKTSYKVIGLKLVLKTKNVPGRQQIDAIGISESSARPIKVKVNELKYSTSVPRPQNLGPNVNSKFSERTPIISPDGRTLYFTRKYHPDNMGKNNYDDIWVSTMQKNGQWGPARNVSKPLNDDNHNFVFSVSPDGYVLYLGNDYKSRAKDGASTSEYKSSGWSYPQSLKISDHYNESVFVGYSMSVDGKVLLMVVQRDDTKGDRDIYVSFKRGSSWSRPQNLGATINTPGIESNVFLAADGKTVYFSSAGHAGYGGLDMFVTRRLDNSWTKWSKPKNLGPKINTPGNDFHYTIPASGDYAYFSTDFNSYGQSDLFRIQLPKEARPEPVQLIKGNLIDAVTNKPINGGDDHKRVVGVVRRGEKPVVPKVEGYVSVSSRRNDEEQELDYDGSDPSVLEEIKKDTRTSQAEDNANAELEALRQRLAGLNKDIAELEEEKPRRAPKNLNDYSDNEYESSKEQPKSKEDKRKKEEKPERRNEPLPQKEEMVRIYDIPDEPVAVVEQPVQQEEDPELAKLRAKYSFGSTGTTVQKVQPKTYKAPTKEDYGVNDYDREATESEIAQRASEIDHNPDAETQQKLADMGAAEQSLDQTKQNYNSRELGNLDDKLSKSRDRKKVAKVQAREPDAVDYEKYRVKTGLEDKPKEDDGSKDVSYDKYRDFGKVESNDEILARKAAEKAAEEKKAADDDDLAKLREKFKSKVNPNDAPTQTPAEKEAELAAAKKKAEEKPLTAKEQKLKALEEKMAALEDDDDAPVTVNETFNDKPDKVKRKEHATIIDVASNTDPAQETTPEVANVPVQEDEPVAMVETVPDNRPSFDEIKQDVRKDLKEELMEEVQRELHDELLDNIKSELETELQSEVKEQLKEDLHDDVEASLRKDLESQIRTDLKDELKDDVRKGLEDEIRADVQGDVEEGLRDELKDEIENELREKMKEQVKNDLKAELRDPIKEQLKKEMEYRLKKELERKLRSELERKIRAQIEQQYRDAQASRGDSPASPDAPAEEYVDLNEDIMMVPIKKGAIIPLTNVFFDANKTTIKETSVPELAQAYDFLVANPNVVVEIGGHTNSLCSTEFAAELSKGRSKSVKEWLIEQGIPENRILYQGYGKTKPIADNSSMAGRKKNQRVEMKIVEILED